MLSIGFKKARILVHRLLWIWEIIDLTVLGHSLDWAFGILCMGIAEQITSLNWYFDQESRGSYNDEKSQIITSSYEQLSYRIMMEDPTTWSLSYEQFVHLIVMEDLKN